MLWAGELKGVPVVQNIRMRGGFGGIIVVTAVLLAAQLITGVQAFPL
jgi:hypothetical protein